MASQGNQQATETFLFAEAAAQGQTVVAASGDSGSTDCYPTQPSTGRHGGRPGRPARRHRGGGDLTRCRRDRRPPRRCGTTSTAQAAAACPRTSTSRPGSRARAWIRPAAIAQCAALGRSSCREVPDVSASSDPAHGYAIYCTAPPRRGLWEQGRLVRGGWYQWGRPAVGRLVAVIDQQLSGAGRADQPGPLRRRLLCRVALQRHHHRLQRPPRRQPGPVPGRRHYDLATGWGTPAAPRLLARPGLAAHSARRSPASDRPRGRCRAGTASP